MSKEDRPRKSWREIDRGRDGSGQRSAPPPQRAREEEHAQKQYRAALEAAFAKGELGKLAEKLSTRGAPSAPAQDAAPAAAQAQDTAVAAAEGGGADPKPAPAPVKGKKQDDKLTLRKKLVEAIGRQEITKAAERYLERFPMPDDHEFLEQLLEHEQEGRVVEAMGRIAALLDQRVLPKRSRALHGKLRYLAETSVSDRTREDADALLKRLG